VEGSSAEGSGGLFAKSPSKEPGPSIGTSSDDILENAIDSSPLAVIGAEDSRKARDETSSIVRTMIERDFPIFSAPICFEGFKTQKGKRI
jgi:hypothetical protein